MSRDREADELVRWTNSSGTSLASLEEGLGQRRELKRAAGETTGTAMTSNNTWPTELRVNPGKDTLRVAFSDGATIVLSAERLRVESPSAEARGHGGAKPPPVRGKENVKISRLEPVGNYAVRIVFDDGHDSGLYSWDYLKQLAGA